MENDPGNHLQLALMRDINGLLEYEGRVLPDREIPVAPDEVTNLDVEYVIINRNEEKGRTLCHLQRPATDEYYWRHDTYVAWDDGRTANFEINIALNDMEKGLIQAVPAAHQALKGELARLVYHDTIEATAAQVTEQMILAEISHIKDEVDEALLEQDDLDEADTIRVIRTILESVDTHLTFGQEPHSDFHHLYAIIRRLKKAQFEAMVVREHASARYYELHDQHMAVAEADPTSTADPAAAWSLLELLDKIR